jgi:hypothetical protein
MRTRALPFVVILLTASAANAQSTWQPTRAPLVNAENTSWFQSAEPILWNGDYYFPAGAPRAFNQYQMVRSGSFTGIPLYTDATLEPYSIVFVPVSGGRVQPYERRRAGELAGTVGSLAPSLPTSIGVETATVSSIAPQALSSPSFAPAYDVGPVDVERPAETRTVVTPAPEVVGTAGRSTYAPAQPVTTALPPTGANGIWVNFDGRRWYAGGKSIAYDAAQLDEIGTYQGWTVYGDKGAASRTTIYIPVGAGRLAAYSRR